jgi:inhibitor of KinA sporulation pathway (predicted exonuclease)
MCLIDLESTNIEEKGTNFKREIIEIGAIKTNFQWQLIDEIDIFIKPQINPTLTEFIKILTNIRQSDVSNAPIFPSALKRFKQWLGKEGYLFVSFGRYDYEQLINDCHMTYERFPFDMRHCNLKEVIRKKLDLSKAKGMPTLINEFKIPLEGTLHRAITDVKAMLKLIKLLNITEEDIYNNIQYF